MRIAEPGVQSRRVRAWVNAAVLCAVSVPGWAAAAGGSAQELLMRMSQAVEARNFDGVFVYQRSGLTDSMRIIHRRDATGSQERLVALSGSPREIIRNGEKVVCIFPDDKSVMVEKSRPRELFRTTFTEPLDRMAAYYRFSVAGPDRVAGRTAQIVAIEPLRKDRYGYRLWIDDDSSLLLKSEIVDTNGAVLEQITFTQISLPETIPDDLLEPDISGEGYTWIAGDEQAAPPTSSTVQWDVGWLPTGFALSDRAVQPLAASPMPVEHLVFSDGLAMVSIFVEQLEQDKTRLEGFSSMGAVNAFSTMTSDHQVTVVGELPRGAVRQIAQSVARRDNN